MKNQEKTRIDVGAYIWPSYTGQEPRSRMFWPNGEGEWQTVRLAEPKFPGHSWPRRPLLGYQDEADPEVMAQQIDLARSHGVNVLIYDWYWFDGRPFLEQCLNNGLLQAKNCESIRFYLMWANHDANHLWDRRLSDDKTIGSTVIWRGRIHPDEWETIVRRWIDSYFCRSNYYKIDGKPVLALYDLHNFVDSFGSIAATRAAMERAQELAIAAGTSGIYFQLIARSSRALNLSGVDGAADESSGILLPFDSATHYQYVHFTDIDRDYQDVMPDVRAEWTQMADRLPMAYWPHVSLGWDNNPRFLGLKPGILRENTPDQIESALRAAKAFAEAHGAPLVTVNSWKEWTEGSYLLPDDRFGYGYLDAVARVFLPQN